MDLDPIAYKKDSKPTEIYAEKHWDAIMTVQYKLIKLVLDLSNKSLLLSQRVLNDITKHLGKNVMTKYLKDGKLFSRSKSNPKTVSHAENLNNPGYKNGRTPRIAEEWDAMMTDVRRSGGVDIPCTSAANITNIVEGSDEHLLLLARDVAIQESQRKSYKIGDGTLQHNAVHRLRDDFGIDDVPATDAQSVLNSMYWHGGVHPFQEMALRELKKLDIPCDDPIQAWSIYQRWLMEEGNHNFQNHATKELEQRDVDIASDANVMSLYQQELMKEGKHPLQIHAEKELKKRGREVLEGESAHSTLMREQAKEGKCPLQNLTADQKKKQAKAISTGHAKVDSKASVKWEAQFTKFEAYQGMPTQTSKEGVWLKAQRARLPKYAEKDEAWAAKLARMKKACIKKNGNF
jgi:hypothetical protein